jgi:proline iminopeptidase
LRNVADRHAGKPGLDAALGAFKEIPEINDDATHVRIARAIMPLYLADYWADEPRCSSMRAALQANHFSGVDEDGAPDLFDDRDELGTLEVPTLIVVGRHDFICGPHWAARLRHLNSRAQAQSEQSD